MEGININDLRRNYVFSDESDSDGELNAQENHYYDYHPDVSATRYRWWRQNCLNCGRVGHTSKHCDRLATQPRCTYCGLAGHKRSRCLLKHEARERNQREQATEERQARAIPIPNPVEAGPQIINIPPINEVPPRFEVNIDPEPNDEAEVIVEEVEIIQAANLPINDENLGAVGGEPIEMIVRENMDAGGIEQDESEEIVEQIAGLLRRLIKR